MADDDDNQLQPDWEGWTTLAELEHALDGILSSEERSVQADSEAHRGHSLTHHIRAAFVESAAPFVSVDTRDTLATELEAALAAATPLIDDSPMVEGYGAKVTALRVANDNIADSIHNIPWPSAASVIAVAQDEIRSFRASLGQHNHHAMKKADEAAEKVAAKAAKLAEELAALDSRVAATRAELDAAITAQASEFDSKVVEARESLAGVKKEVELQAEQSKKDFEALLEEANDNIEGDRSDWQKEWDALNARITKSHAELRDEAKLLLDKAGETLSAASSAAHAKWYDDKAKSETKLAVRYQAIGIVSILAVGYLLLEILSEGASNQHDGTTYLGLVLSRLAVSSVLIWLALHMFKQGALHRDREKEAADRALIMGTFPTFIANLPDDTRLHLMTEMATSPMFSIDGRTTLRRPDPAPDEAGIEA